MEVSVRVEGGSLLKAGGHIEEAELKEKNTMSERSALESMEHDRKRNARLSLGEKLPTVTPLSYPSQYQSASSTSKDF